MKLSFRFFARFCFLILVTVFLAAGLVLAWFTSWRADKDAVLQAASEVADTSAGKVEFLTRGDGPSVLVFHGAPGGYDQAALLGAALEDSGFQVIAPSRPGYLHTPLASGILPEQQADAMAALLNTIGSPSVAVMGVSSGAPAAIEFVLRHPDRVWALVLVSAITKRTDHKSVDPGAVVLKRLTGDVGSWVCVEMAERDPRRMLDLALASEGLRDPAQRGQMAAAVLGNRAQLEWFQSFLGTFAPLAPRETGTRNDILQNRNLNNFPFDRIQAPVLMVHGTLDPFFPYGDAVAAAGRMPGATLVTVEGAGHLTQLGPQAPEVQKRITEFLRQYSGGHSQP